MPSLPRRPCLATLSNGRPCPQITPCPTHGVRAHRQTSSSSRGYGHAWRKIRDAFIAQHPLCACGAPARVADHVLAKAKGGTDDEGNLQALCFSCHNKKTYLVDSRQAMLRFVR